MTVTLLADPVLDLVLRGTLAALFATAALHKLRDRAAFREVVRAYRIVPDAAADAALGIALGELAVALALLVPSTRTSAALGAVLLLALYSTAIAVNLARGRRSIDCGCGPLGDRQPIGEWLLVRNALLIGAAALTVRAPSARALVWIDWLTVVGGVGVAMCTWMAAHTLAGTRTLARTGTVGPTRAAEAAR